MTLSELQPLLSALAGVRVACVGDLMVDRFVHGEVARISAEAPVPVMARRSEDVMLGAVGNVARNIAALGGRAALAAVVGDDSIAHEAAALIGQSDGGGNFQSTGHGDHIGLVARSLQRCAGARHQQIVEVVIKAGFDNQKLGHGGILQSIRRSPAMVRP